MNHTWITPAEAMTIISKNNHHAVSLHHVQALIHRGKIGMRVLPDGRQLLKRSHVEATRVAVGTGNLHHKNRACLASVVTVVEKIRGIRLPR